MNRDNHGNAGQKLYDGPTRDNSRAKVTDTEYEQNACPQTGEEFSAGFFRDPVGSRRMRVETFVDPQYPQRMFYNQVQSNRLMPEDVNARRLHSGHRLNVIDCISGKRYEKKVESPPYLDSMRRNHWDNTQGQGSYYFRDEYHGDWSPCAPTTPSYHASGSPSHFNYRLGNSDVFSSGKMKFLCSFGGRILPRPVDGNLRYVGGETKIISIRTDLTFDGLMKKTNAICNQPHSIRYQLPDEDLDALISVSSDEDLHHMIEEYRDLERLEGSPKLRLFLISLSDPGSPHSFESTAIQHGDTDQFVSAVNGTSSSSPRKSSSGQSAASQKIQLFNNTNNVTDVCIDITTHPSTPQTFNQSLSLSSLTFQPRDPQNNQTSEGKTIGETGIGYVQEQQYLESLNFLDTTSYYYQDKQSNTPIPMSNSIYDNVAGLDRRKDQNEVHLHTSSPRGNYTPSPLRSISNIYSERSPMNETALHNLSEVQPAEPNEMIGYYHRTRALSDSKLKDREERFFPSVEKETVRLFAKKPESAGSPLLRFSKTPQESILLQQVRLSEEVHNSFIQGSFHMESHKSGQELRISSGKDVFSELDAIPCTETIQIERLTCIKSSIPSKPENNLGSSPLISLEYPLELPKRDNYQNYPFNTASPDLMIKGQECTRDQQFSMTRNIREASSSLDSTLVAAVRSPPIDFQSQDLSRNTASSREVYIQDDYRANSSDQVVDNAGLQEQFFYLYGVRGAKTPHKQASHDCQNSNIMESPVVIEDVTGATLPDVQECLNVVPRVQDESTSESLSMNESDAGCSSFEDANDHDQDKDRTFTNVAIAEMEAGIHGLQIIKNDDLEDLHELGSGTFGTVYHGKWRGTDVAIKRIKKSCFSGRSSEQERLKKDFWREAKILSNLHHPNVLAFYGVVPDGPGGTLATVTEYMVNGSLRHALMKKDRTLDRRKKLIIAMDAAFGMEYLHLKNIVHFDLKCDNLLVNLRDPQRPICKVGDFGLSRIKRNTLVTGGVRGSLPWMAPELLSGSSSRVSEKVDVFSFGVTLWEIFTGEEPYAEMHCGAIIGGIVNNSLRPPIPEGCDPEWRKLMEECWSPDPAARPSFTEITGRLREQLMKLPGRASPR